MEYSHSATVSFNSAFLNHHLYKVPKKSHTRFLRKWDIQSDGDALRSNLNAREADLEMESFRRELNGLLK